jgi:hypothetical protein
MTDPHRYGSSGGAYLADALMLAHAHCLLHDVFAADARLDLDAVYCGLVGRFLEDLAPPSAVVTM